MYDYRRLIIYSQKTREIPSPWVPGRNTNERQVQTLAESEKSDNETFVYMYIVSHSLSDSLR